MSGSTLSDVYTATDVARDTRRVLDEGHRPTGALIRDTDGTALLLSPAMKAQLDRYTRTGFRDTAHLLLRIVRPPSDEFDTGALGNLAWLSVLPLEDRVQFAVEYLRVLDQADGLGDAPVEQLVYEWQQTARAWADEDVRAGLVGDLPEPLHDVEL